METHEEAAVVEQTEMRERVEPAVMAPLAAATFLAMMNALALGPFIPKIADDLNSSVPVIGQVATIALVCSALSALFIGPLSDRYGHRRTILLGLLAIAISAIGAGLAVSYLMLLTARVFTGIGLAMTASIALAIAGSLYTGAARLRAISLISSAMSIAAILGVPLLTGVAAFGGWRGGFFFVTACALVILAISFVALPHDAELSRAPFRRRELVEAYIPLLRTPAMRRLYLAIGLFFMGWSGSLVYVGAFYIESLGYSLNEVGIAYLCGGGGFFIGTTLAGGRLQQANLRHVFAATAMLAGLALGAHYGLPLGVYLPLLLIGLVGITGGFTVVALNTLLAGESPARLGTTMLLRGSVVDASGALGTVTCGLLIATIGFSALGVALPALAIAAALVSLRQTPATLPIGESQAQIVAPHLDS
jgi:DHA1 family inner membrane transport protein